MTQAEFNVHHKEFIKNFDAKYMHLDLNFDSIMFMRGVSKEEFDEKIKYINAQSWSEVMIQDNINENDNSHGWIDEEDSEYDSFSRGEDSNGDSNYGEDSNEY